VETIADLLEFPTYCVTEQPQMQTIPPDQDNQRQHDGKEVAAMINCRLYAFLSDR